MRLLFSSPRFAVIVLALNLISNSALSIDTRSSLASTCLDTIQKLFLPARTRLIPAGNLNSSPIRNFQQLNESLSPYFLLEDPQGWDRQLEKAVSTTFLNGNSGGSERLVFSDGSRLVTKRFLLGRSKLDQARKIVEQMKNWEKKGEGAAFRGVSITEIPRTGEVALKIIMEDLTAAQNSIGNTKVSGMGIELHALRNYSVDSRNWVADRMIKLLDMHPDPHPKNVFFRVTKLSPFGKLPPEGSYYREGDLIFQVLLIDATGEEGIPNHSIRSGDPRSVPDIARQYNRQYQTVYFKQQLNLPIE